MSAAFSRNPPYHMLQPFGIKQLYTLALAEGEGVGTAYEYYAKRLLLNDWLKRSGQRPRTMLVAGLPQKYGSSLDAFLLGHELNSEVTVIDDRQAAIDKLRDSLERLDAEGTFRFKRPVTSVVGSFDYPEMADGQFDLIISSEVLQRLGNEARTAVSSWAGEHGNMVAFFAPNSGNDGHTTQSGLSGLTLGEMIALAGPLSTKARTGYIDMPPFPPGITRSDEQRTQASSGRREAAAMKGLEYYARLESRVPMSIRAGQAHIVYALSPAG